jgi:hypothetical protein
MPSPTLSELRKALIAEGFEIYRTIGPALLLADRVRDNLIMDSLVSAVSGDTLAVRFVVRAQRSDFPGEGDEQLFQRARQHVHSTEARGYREFQTNVVPIRDPGDRSRTLDTWYEVSFEKPVSDLPELLDELRYALSLDKTTSRS